MFTAFFDASGDSHCQAALSVGGFVALADAWIDWETEWNSRLRADGLETFHRNEITCWPPSRRERLVEDLAGIIRSHAAYKIGVVIFNRDLSRHLSNGEMKQWHVEAYSLAGRTAAKEVRIWSSGWGGRLPEMIFEDGDKGKGKLEKIMSKQGYPAPIFKPKRTHTNKKSGLLIEGCVPLQAADLYAYELFNRARDISLNKPTPASLDRLHPQLDKIPGIAGFIGGDRIEFLKQGMNQVDSLIMKTDVRVNVKKQ